MLRLEMPRRPSASRFELDAQKIPNLKINAVAHFSQEFTFRIGWMRAIFSPGIQEPLRQIYETHATQ